MGMDTTTAKCIKCGRVGPHKVHPIRADDQGDKQQPMECEVCGACWEMPTDPAQRAKWIMERALPPE